MARSFILCVFVALACASLHADQASPPGAPATLRCEYLTDPLGIDETQPRLGWISSSPARNVAQSAYQVLVASSLEILATDKGDLWDSGKVASDESAHVEYAGKPLTSRVACFWKVRVWTGEVTASAWSTPARWTVGLLKPQDWVAKWIDPTAGEIEKPITIKRAIWGTSDGKHTRDVTAKLKSLVQDGSIRMSPNGEAFGLDPAPNRRKVLLVDYEQDGVSHSGSVEENAPFTLSKFMSAVKYIRKPFATTKPVRTAMLYVTALGLYDIHLNGKRVGDHIIAPDFTDYAKRVRYQCYDVAPLLQSGKNALAAQLANGWYAGHIGNGGFQPYGKIPVLMAQLEITFMDGSKQVVATDASWKSHNGPITATDFMLGESYDARAEIAGWDDANLEDAAWQAVKVREEAPRALDSQVAPPVRELGTIAPKKMTEPVPGRYVFDLGQNMVGVCRIKINAPAGTKITIRHAEMLDADGTLYTTNLRGAPSIDSYICKAGGEQTWQPRFTFHGFRFVEITGLTKKPSITSLTGVVLGSDIPFTGSFVSSNADINQLFSNIQWGQRGNFLSIPTDCPQRDERLGWMGDAQVFIRTATGNANVAAFFTKWLVDVDDAQTPDGAFMDISPAPNGGGGTPAWGDAGVICPWTIYEAYGDKRVLERHLPAMIKWVEWCKTHSTNLIRDKDLGGNFGDWLSIKADSPKDVIGTAYFAYSTDLVAKACEVVGKTAEASKYRKLFQDIVTAFNKHYVTSDGRIHGDTQCVYAMALKFDLLPENLRSKAVERLAKDIADKDNHLSTGFVGVSYLLPMLTKGNRADVAYKLLMQDSFPSWLFSVKHGATTIWERWDGWTPEKGFQDPGMNSFNHYSLGSCGEWLYDTVAGIAWDTTKPGYKHIRIQPQPGGGMTSAKATLGSVYGPISSAWTQEPDKFVLEVTIPANTTATVILPASSSANITENGQPLASVAGLRIVSEARKDSPNVAVSLGSGTYHFVAKR